MASPVSRPVHVTSQATHAGCMQGLDCHVWLLLSRSKSHFFLPDTAIERGCESTCRPALKVCKERRKRMKDMPDMKMQSDSKTMISKGRNEEKRIHACNEHDLASFSQ